MPEGPCASAGSNAKIYVTVGHLNYSFSLEFDHLIEYAMGMSSVSRSPGSILHITDCLQFTRTSYWLREHTRFVRD